MHLKVETNNTIRITIRIIAAILAVLWMIRIFDFSSEDAEESGSVSRSMSYNLIEKISRHLDLGWDEEKIEAVAGPVEKYLRKVAHMYEYAVMSILWCIALDAWKYVGVPSHHQSPDADDRGKQSERIKRFIRPGIVLLICLIYAVSDEFHQIFVDGRSGEIRDVCLDFGGALIGMLLGAFIVFIYRRRRRRSQPDPASCHG